MQEITGILNIGREGLGCRKTKFYSSCSSKEKRDLIIKAVREKEEEKRIVNMTALSLQGSHLKWEVPQRRIKQEDLTVMPEERLKFLIKSVYDLLPTPANKQRWFETDESCSLCGGNGSLNHILAGCDVALSQGRYTWRHNKVLRELASIIQEKLLAQHTKQNDNRSILFVKPGEKIEPNKSFQQESFLSSAEDWKMTVDLEKRLRIPEKVALTDLRPDITIMSELTKQMVLIELTVPTEERIEISGELKRSKYECIVTEGKKNGWRMRCYAVEIGCRGFPAASMSRLLKDLGYVGQERRKKLEKMGKIAEEASRKLWKASQFKSWGRQN